MPAYGKVKVDTITYDLSGTATDVSVADIATKASPTFTGTVTVPSPSAGDDSTKAASTAFVVASFATKASPTFTGTVTVPTASANDNTTKAASTAYVQTELGDYLTTALGAPKANPTFTGDVTLNAQGDLRFADSDSSNWVAFQAPATVGSNVTWTLPAADGSASQLLTTDGSGALSWSTVSGGVSSDAQQNTVGGTNSGDSFTGTSAENNTLYGYDTGTAITTGDANICIGHSAGKTITTGYWNVAIGLEAMSAGSGHTSQGNIGIGTYALKILEGGQKNIAIGRYTGQSLVSGQENVIVGADSGKNYTGSQLVALGADCLEDITTGDLNTGLGNGALRNVNTGENNTGVGYRTGYGVTTGDNNTFLGYQAGQSSSPSGNVTTADNIICLGNNDVTALYCVTSLQVTSDARDKTDVTDFTHGLDWINKLRSVTYRWDKRSWYEDGKPNGTKKKPKINIGFLAQEAIEVEQSFGYADKKDNFLIANQDEEEKDPSYSMQYERLVPVLVNAVKELSAKVELLEAKLNG